MHKSLQADTSKTLLKGIWLLFCNAPVKKITKPNNKKHSPRAYTYTSMWKNNCSSLSEGDSTAILAVPLRSNSWLNFSVQMSRGLICWKISFTRYICCHSALSWEGPPAAPGSNQASGSSSLAFLLSFFLTSLLQLLNELPGISLQLEVSLLFYLFFKIAGNIVI